jgi:hypothetical protein
MFHTVFCRPERSIPRRTLYDFIWEGQTIGQRTSSFVMVFPAKTE